PYAYIMAAYEVPPSPDYILGPEYMPLEDKILPAEEQPLPAAAPPTTDSLGYVPESDPEEEPEEDDEDPEEDPADYPADRDDDDDEDEDEDEEEEEEHPAPADSVPPVHRMTARLCSYLGQISNIVQGPRFEISVIAGVRLLEPSISLPPREEVERLLALTTLPPSPLTPLSSPLPQIPSPPPNSPTHIEIPESCLPLRKRVRFASPTPSREVGESSAAGAARQDRPIMAREAWGLSMDAIDYAPDHRRQRVISELLASDHKRQVQLTKTLRLLKGLQTQMVEFQRQHGPAKGPAQPDAPGEAGSSS
ncbi:hypothetical protein Tco_1471905, partial [Tanacetum coccineum]